MLIGLAFIGSGAEQTPVARYAFAWKPRPSQVIRYGLTLHVDLAQTKLTLTADLIQTVGRPDKKGIFQVTTATKNVRVVTDTDTQNMPEERPSVEKYGPNGQRLAGANDPTDWFSTSLGHCTDFVPPPAPVKVGDKWSSPVRSGGGLLDGRLEYRLLDLTKRGKSSLLHVRYSFAEASAHLKVRAEGYLYIDPHDFSVVESDAVVHNARISPDLPPSPEIEVRMVRLAK